MQGSLTWPSLTSDRPIRFPLTHVGNISHKILTLENPADVPVVIQVVPLSIYPDAQSAIDVLSDRYVYHNNFVAKNTRTTCTKTKDGKEYISYRSGCESLYIT